MFPSTFFVPITEFLGELDGELPTLLILCGPIGENLRPQLLSSPMTIYISLSLLILVFFFLPGGLVALLLLEVASCPNSFIVPIRCRQTSDFLACFRAPSSNKFRFSPLLSSHYS